MLKVKDKYDYREEFCAALRSGHIVPEPLNLQFCVLAQFNLTHGLPESEWYAPPRQENKLNFIRRFYEFPADKLGITSAQVDRIFQLNDNGSFGPEIATFIENLP